MTQQPLIIQRFHQHLLSKSRIIPTRTNKKQILILVFFQRNSIDKAQYNFRRSALVNRKHKTNLFIFLQIELQRLIFQRLRDKDQIFILSFRELICNPFRVTCTGEIKYHRRVYKKAVPTM